MSVDPLVPSEGWGVLHLFHRLDHVRAAAASPDDVDALVEALEKVAADVQAHTFSVLGHKADTMTLLLAEDVTRLRAAQTTIDAAGATVGLELDWSYLSLTEGSEYTDTPDEYRTYLEGKAQQESTPIDDETLERRVREFAERVEARDDAKLHPELPDWPLACFYPMSHRREGADNWYSLDFAERKRLMGEHGRSGRAFGGRVLQLVSGSTGLDDWEWGVTLLAHELKALKDIVYTLRYDEASARYGEFGPFVIGMRRTPRQLVDELGLPSGS